MKIKYKSEKIQNKTKENASFIFYFVLQHEYNHDIIVSSSSDTSISLCTYETEWALELLDEW